jgi:hypothetical protein
MEINQYKHKKHANYVDHKFSNTEHYNTFKLTQQYNT